MAETMSHAFAPPNYETFRETAEKAVSQAKNTYEKAKLASEQATDLLRKTYATAARALQTTTSRSLSSPVPIRTLPLTTPKT